MTICIAAVCRHEKEFAVILCADYRGTRGNYIHSDDLHKIWHFVEGGAIMYAGDSDAGHEFCRQFAVLAREWNAIEKTEGDGDIRLGQYLAKTRSLVLQFKRARANHVLGTKYCLSLDDVYAPDAQSRLPAYGEIVETIKNVNLGAEFLIAYTADVEPEFIRIDQSGHVWSDPGHYIAIGSGEPLAAAIFSQIDQDGYQSLHECLTWVFQAKVAAQNNPYVGETTQIWVLFKKQREFMLSDEAWEILMKTPGIVLAPFDERLVELKSKIFKKYKGL